jgi:hypothetical protein
VFGVSAAQPGFPGRIEFFGTHRLGVRRRPSSPRCAGLLDSTPDEIPGQGLLVGLRELGGQLDQAIVDRYERLSRLLEERLGLAPQRQTLYLQLLSQG